MYSVPYPPSSAIPPIKAPYVAVSRYSLSGLYSFENFLDHTDAILPCLVLVGLGCSKPHIAASVVQSWLFFGLASEALGRDVDHMEFVETSDGHSEGLIDIRIPKWFWVELRERLEHLRTTLPTEDFEKKRRNLSDCFVHTFGVLRLRDCAEDKEIDETLEIVFLSVQMLHCVIADVLGIPSDYCGSAADLSSKSTQVLLRRMIENGWCRRRLNFINAVTIPYPSLYYLSSISPLMVSAPIIYNAPSQLVRYIPLSRHHSIELLDVCVRIFVFQ